MNPIALPLIQEAQLIIWSHDASSIQYVSIDDDSLHFSTGLSLHIPGELETPPPVSIAFKAKIDQTRIGHLQAQP
jgi:hypothetical protein